MFVQIFDGLDDSSNDYLYESDHTGSVVLIDDQATVQIKNLNPVLNAGIYVNVFLTKQQTDLLPSPYGVCQFADQVSTHLVTWMNLNGYNYTRKNCLTFCEQEMIIEAIGCYDWRLPPIYNAKPCSTRDQFNNISNVVFDYDHCYEDCPFECSTISYDVSTSYADYPTYDYYVNQKKTNTKYYQTLFTGENINDLTYDDFHNVIEALFVGFDQLSYTYVSNSPSFEIPDIFANVGGVLGLFIGTSILSFVEIVDLIYNIIAITVRIYRNRNNIRKEEFSIDTASTRDI